MNLKTKRLLPGYWGSYKGTDIYIGKMRRPSKVSFSRISDAEKWDDFKSFWIPNWRVVRWILKRFGAKVVDPRSIVI